MELTSGLWIWFVELFRCFWTARAHLAHSAAVRAAMEFECNTPVYWLRDARMDASAPGGRIVRVVLLAPVGMFPAGYVGMMDDPRPNDEHDTATIIMYPFSLIDPYYYDNPGVAVPIQVTGDRPRQRSQGGRRGNGTTSGI